MDITKYIPNIFGRSAPTTYEGLLNMGLLTPEQVEKTQRTANIQGLLGAGLALAQGMSKIGPPRTAAENILGALAGGFGAAGGAYQQGLQNIAQQQQLQSALLTQQQAVGKIRAIQEAKQKYPDIASLADIDPNKFAEEVVLRERVKGFGAQGKATPESLRSQAQGAYLMGNKPLGDSFMEQANRIEIESRIRPVSKQAPAAPTDTTAPAIPTVIDGTEVLPLVQVTDESSLLFSEKNRLLEQNRALLELPTEDARKARKANLEQIAAIDEQLKQVTSSRFDWANIEKEVPENFKGQVRNLKSLAEGGYLPLSDIRAGIQNIYSQVQESAKGMRIEGLPGNYAAMKYGTSDQTKLDPQQLADVIAFANAPTADQYAQLQRENVRTRFETGRGYSVPAGRSSFLANIPVRSTETQQVVPQTTVTEPSPKPAARLQTQPSTRDTEVAAATGVKSTTKAKIPEGTPEQTRYLYEFNKDAIINRSDIPPRDKKDLLIKKPGLESAVNYSLTSIIDARDAAQALLNNPKYIDSLTGRLSPLLVQSPILSQDAKTANDLLQNILTRSFVKEIQQMREASPTGGAVGSVTEREMDALSKVSASLSVGMNKDEFVRQLNNYLRIANRSISSIPKEYSKTYGYSGEFDDLLTSSAVATENIGKQKTPVEIELERRKKEKK